MLLGIDTTGAAGDSGHGVPAPAPTSALVLVDRHGPGAWGIERRGPCGGAVRVFAVAAGRRWYGCRDESGWRDGLDGLDG